MLNGAVPAFELDSGVTVVILRGLTSGGLQWVFGACIFLVFVAPRSFPRMPAEAAAAVSRCLTRLIGGGLLWSGAALFLWLAWQAGLFTDAASVRLALAAIPNVLLHTLFGHVIALQLASVGVTALLYRRPEIASISAGVALALQAGHSHALSMQSGPSILLLSEIAHLLAAGGWLGGLIPLLVLVRMAPARGGAVAARWFSPLGKLCVTVIAVTALIQGSVMVGSFAALLGTAYGWIALSKLALFGVLFGFALLNRYRFAPALVQAFPASSKRRLVSSIALQAGFGVLIVLVAGLLASLPPGMHTQIVWPFTQRLSLAAVEEAPEFRQELMDAVLALLGATSLVVFGLFVSRWTRWCSFAAASVIVWYAVPHFELLLAPAYPTSYETSPTDFSATSITRGAALYKPNCASCHGDDGRGDGPAGAGLLVPPADLTAAHLWDHSDGEMAWWLAHGIDGPQNRLVMPGFAESLDTDERWSLIDFLYAHNAGVAFQENGRWPMPVRAPGFEMRCTEGVRSLDDLRGSTVLVVLAGKIPSPVPPGIVVVRAADIQPKPGLCAASDPAIGEAYRVVAGFPSGQKASFLLDANGLLRYAAPAGWTDPAQLAALVGTVERGPKPEASATTSHHHAM